MLEKAKRKASTNYSRFVNVCYKHIYRYLLILSLLCKPWFRYNKVVTLKFVDEIVKCNYSNKSYWAVLCCGVSVLWHRTNFVIFSLVFLGPWELKAMPPEKLHAVACTDEGAVSIVHNQICRIGPQTIVEWFYPFKRVRNWKFPARTN